MRKFIGVVYFGVMLLFASCSGNKQASESDAKDEEVSVVTSASPVEPQKWEALSEIILKDPDGLDLNMDLSGFTLWQVRILRNVIPARQGYLFMESDLRSWFQESEWYNTRMEARWYGECEYSGEKKQPPIAYSSEEAGFMDRCKKQEELLRKEMYIEQDGKRTMNLNNVVNIWMFNNLKDDIKAHLETDEFVMLTGENVQFFQLYEENDYSQTPNFVATDMLLHLGHIHTSFLVRVIEEEYLSKAMSDLYAMIARKLAADAIKYPARKADIEYLQAFFAVGAALGGESLNNLCPASYLTRAKSEVDLIKGEKDNFSSLMPSYQGVMFPYSMFKPRGHYTRSETLQMYFKMVNWMQWASFCLEDENEFRQAVIASGILSDPEILGSYNHFMEITQFFFGKPDNLSALELNNITSQALASDKLNASDLSGYRKQAIAASEKKNVIRPKVVRGCEAKVNFMPARYMFDNEILMNMAWIKEDGSTDRPYPKGLDVFAAMGDKTAEKILTDEYKEDKNWKDYIPNLRTMQKKFANYDGWDESVYNKTMQVLKMNLWVDKRAPAFMRTENWKRKNLNASLGAWAELKHDAVLYAEQPFAAECGGGGECDPPPAAIVKGYVEPNTEVYLKMIELLDQTSKILAEMPQVESFWKSRTENLKEMTQFLLDISRRQLDGKAISDEDYRKIEVIGATAEWLTLEMMGVYEWFAVRGADREVALVADVYTNNEDKKKAGILHVATGNVNDLYVVVRIGDNYYLTRGGTFSYREFVKPLDERMTDEEWQELLKQNKAPEMQEWMKAIYVPTGVAPAVEEIQYSSGC
jgi:hypothetical protein